jgi:hypothetical protein
MSVKAFESRSSYEHSRRRTHAPRLLTLNDASLGTMLQPPTTAVHHKLPAETLPAALVPALAAAFVAAPVQPSAELLRLYQRQEVCFCLLLLLLLLRLVPKLDVQPQ